ncbi:MAG: hypothetical protein NT069_27800 [Planctomycetota bacterium]|nr:hypothetical protein [Planctomycetota bacterium]
MSRFAGVACLAWILFGGAMGAAGPYPEDPVNDGEPNERAVLRKILGGEEAGDALPKGVVLRLEADLFNSISADEARESESNASAKPQQKRFRELWEFTTDRVHRVVSETSQDPKGGYRLTYRRVESKRCDTSKLGKVLLDADFFSVTDLADEDFVHFAGTDFELGHRSISVVVEGKEKLIYGESCASGGYSKTKAQAFGRLYETLAKRARDVK